MQQLMAKQTSKFDACINPKAILTIQSSSFKHPETLNIKLLTSKECRLLTSMCSFKNKLRSLFFFKFYPSLSYVYEFHCFRSHWFTMSCMYILASLYTQYFVKCPGG